MSWHGRACHARADKTGYDVSVGNFDNLDPSNPFARAILPRTCIVCERGPLPPEYFPLPTFSPDGHYIVPNTCLECRRDAERDRRLATKETTCLAT